jgi:hypothetical protein
MCKISLPTKVGPGMTRYSPKLGEGEFSEAHFRDPARHRSYGAESVRSPCLDAQPHDLHVVALDKGASACTGQGTAAEEMPVERGCRRSLGRDCITPRVVSGPFGTSKPHGPAAFTAATIPTVRHLLEQCAACKRQIAPSRPAWSRSSRRSALRPPWLWRTARPRLTSILGHTKDRPGDSKRSWGRVLGASQLRPKSRA